jgi:fatty acid desaturase
LFLMAGQGLHLLGIIGHDGSHGNLHRVRFKSMTIGIMCSSIVPLHCDVGFSIWHAEHHRWLNGEKDPDAALLGRYRSYLRRVLLVRSIVTRNYLRYTVRLATNRWPEDHFIRLGVPRETLVRFARLNLACCLAWLSLFVTLTVRAPLVGICILWAPYAGAALLSGMRPYVEHAGTSTGEFDGARSYTNGLFTFLFGGANYHLAHHLFPTVPCYRLPAFHRWLESTGHFGGASLHVDPTLSGYVRYAGMRYPSPVSVPGDSPT